MSKWTDFFRFEGLSGVPSGASSLFRPPSTVGGDDKGTGVLGGTLLRRMDLTPFIDLVGDMGPPCGIEKGPVAIVVG